MFFFDYSKFDRGDLSPLLVLISPCLVFRELASLSAHSLEGGVEGGGGAEPDLVSFETNVLVKSQSSGFRRRH